MTVPVIIGTNQTTTVRLEGDTRGGARRHRIKRILCGSRTVKLSAGELTRGAPVRLRLRRPFANTPKSSEYSEGEIKFR